MVLSHQYSTVWGCALSAILTVAVGAVACVREDDVPWIAGYAVLALISALTNLWLAKFASAVGQQTELLALELNNLAVNPAASLGSFGNAAASSEVLMMSDALARAARTVTEFRSYVPATALQSAEKEAERSHRQSVDFATGDLVGFGDGSSSPNREDDEDTDEDTDDDDDIPSHVIPSPLAKESTRSNDTKSNDGRGSDRPGLVKSMSKFFRRESNIETLKHRQGQRQSGGGECLAKLGPGKHRNVCVMMCNMRRTMEFLNADVETAIDGHRRYLTSVLTAAKDWKGIADTFSGDRVMIHFNASVPVATYRKNACNCALVLTGDIQSQREAAAFGSSVGVEVHPKVGIASGRALIGDQGVPEMRRYQVMGDVVLHGVLLCSAARIFDEEIMADAGVKTDCEMHFVFRSRNRFKYAKTCAVIEGHVLTRKRGVQTKKARAEADAKDEEWMYRVEGAESSDPVTLLNNAWESFLEGEPEKAKELLEKSSLAQHQKEWLFTLLNGPTAGEGKDYYDILDPRAVL
eukprot:Hpha_TRINITY_DN15142_c3_g1::TRINITY_DN15142_c3_g1_i1::g.129831::m.129831